MGAAIQFIRPGAVGIHGPDRLADAGALVDVLPTVIHDAAVIENHRTEFADRTLRELFDVAAVGVHAVQGRGHEMAGAAAQDRVLGPSRGEDDLAVGQVTRMNIVGVPGTAPTGHPFGLVRRRKRDLTQTGAVNVDFPDPKSRLRILAKIEQDLFGVERQADLADEALAAWKIGGPDDGTLRTGAQIVDVDAVVGHKAVRTGAAIDVGVIVIGRIRLAFDEKELLEVQSRRIDSFRRGGRGGEGLYFPPLSLVPSRSTRPAPKTLSETEESYAWDVPPLERSGSGLPER